MADHSNNPLVVRRGCGYDEEKQMLICQGRRNDNWHVEHVAVDCCVEEMCNKDFVPTVSPITLNKPGMILPNREWEFPLFSVNITMYYPGFSLRTGCRPN